MSDSGCDEADEFGDEQDDRDRGVLTAADREYLRGESDLSEGSEFNTRKRIRQRIRDAILDFPLIFASLSDRDREKLFAELFASDEERSAAIEAMNAMVAFAFDGVREQGLTYNVLVNGGIRTAWERHVDENMMVVVDSEISATVEQRSMPLPQMTRVRRVLAEGYDVRDLTAGEQATLLLALESHSEIDPAAEAIESFDEYIDELYEATRELQDGPEDLDTGE